MNDDEEEVVRDSRKIKDVKRRRLLMAIGLVFLISLSAMGAGSLASYLSVRHTAVNATVFAQQVHHACQSPGTISPDLAQFCPEADHVVDAAPAAVKADPVPGPPGPSGSPGTNGTNGTDGVDATSIPGKNGKNGTNGINGVSGTNGQNGSDGKDAVVTLAQVVAAFDQFCADSTICTGPSGPPGRDGADGVDGQDGKDGTDGATGPQGPPVKVEDGCEPAPDGQVITDITTTTDPDTNTVTIECSYKDDETTTPLLKESRTTR